MIKQVSDKVWFGDKPSPWEGEWGSIINAAHSLRRPYWSDLGKLPHQTWYFRLALPDAEHASLSHIRMLELTLDGIQGAGKLPLLCHCRMGGHRGPMTAMFSHWHWAGRTRAAFAWANERVFGLVPGLARHTFRRGYKTSLLAYMERESK